MKEIKPNRFLEMQDCPNFSDLQRKDAQLNCNRFACNRCIYNMQKRVTSTKKERKYKRY